MKTRYKIFMFIVFNFYGLYTQAVNLDSISEKKRNELLISMSKDVLLRYGPGYYREDPKPIIGRASRTNDFKVTYLPKPDERFEWSMPAIVYFDNPTGLPASITFGNGIIVDITAVFRSYIEQKYYGKKNKVEKLKKLVDKETVLPISYQTAIPRTRVVETTHSSNTLSSKAITNQIPNDTSRIKKKFKYQGYYLSGNDTIRMYQFVKDTIIP